MADIGNIELRSEKTRQIIGMVPSGIVRYGTLIITIHCCTTGCIIFCSISRESAGKYYGGSGC